MDYSEEVLTEEDLAKKLKVNRATLWDLRKNKGLPHVRINKLIRYRWPDVDRWLEEQNIDVKNIEPNGGENHA